MKSNKFIRCVIKIATAIVVAVIVLSILVWSVSEFQNSKEKTYAKQFESIKPWPVDLKQNLQFTLLARTKLVNGTLLANVTIDGYPAYLTDPRLQAANRDAGITLVFQDKDGFKVHARSIAIGEFSGMVDSNDVPSGLSYEFTDNMNVVDYERIFQLRVQWTLKQLSLQRISLPFQQTRLMQTTVHKTCQKKKD